MSECDECKNLRKSKDDAYRERNQLVAAFARLCAANGLNVGMGRHEGKDWEDDWRNIVYIDWPANQLSWHIHDSEMSLFKHFAQYNGTWDGHSTEEKYRRLDVNLP